jgi:hypothetical protein
MPCFDQEFINAKGTPIYYQGQGLVRIDRIRVNKVFSGYFRLISTNSKWKQGIRIQVDGSLTINSCKGKSFIVWSKDIKGNVPFEGSSKKQQLNVWNAWDDGSGRTDAWLNGAAMIVEVNGNKRRYKCNDGHSDDNFDDIVFEVVINE